MPSSPPASPVTSGDVSVAVVVPARDERDTVGEVVSRLRRCWVEDTPLVDELVVIDSDSVDDTADVARAAGATVHRARDVRPDLGRAQGKGEALWKALHVTTAEVLVFIDADLVAWDPAYVPGLLAPLQSDPATQLVKAVYHRPLLDGQGHEIESGGRVTELVARPLLALHRPELVDIVQPLSGEWSIRRSAFERYAVPVGYGVEIAALLDTASTYGVGAIAQATLPRRAHRHHRHDTLGPMALQVMSAVERRVRTPADGAAEGGDPVLLRQFDPASRGFTARDRHVDIAERPPAISVPDYPARSR